MNEKKRVVHLTTVHHPHDPRIYHKECKSLKKAGFDVYLIAKETEAGVDKESGIKHIPIKDYTSRWERMTKGAWTLYKQAKKLDADVYHFHDPELLPVAWLLKNNRNHVIYDIHEDYITSMLQKEYLPKPVRKFAAKIYKKMEQFFTKKMELILAEKYYKDIYPDGDCVLNYPMVNTAFLKHQREGEAEDKLIYTGNVTDVRGAYLHAKLPLIDEKITMNYIGKCSIEFAEEIYRIAKDQANRIYITGVNQYIPKEKIEQAYLNHNWLAGVAIFPETEHYMKKELTKFFEYMNAGIPIICSNFPVWKNFIDTYQCGITVDPHNEQEIKDALEYLRNHPDEAKQMGENGKKAVQEQLNWGKEEEKLINIYQHLLHK
ncbi:glycosyltransferase [Oceanobacillus jeddahense]|uniref:Glycosyltransferase n=1 Tax=Oceanobacillus jeddahense TaxID=1462527 RepID=A0ABY5JQH8_9BACI|nr:glycosyltransferase [Oceanobacillus jeddahense]UUI02570.1 glycosyltransferase [Oceanobacillus jeddahense]